MELFGTSGIRRIADRDLLELALKTGLAAGEVYSEIVVGCDTRTTSEALKHAFIAGALMSGAKCADAGVLPTPTLAFTGREFKAAAMITASHNPPEYNGIKLLSPDGAGFDAAQRKQIEDLIEGNQNHPVLWRKVSNTAAYTGAVEKHSKFIQDSIKLKNPVRVALDCGCGAGSVITPYLLKQMGCEVIALHSYPSGIFPHPVEPTEANLKDLIWATKEFGVDIGIAHDGDADRMMAIDSKGRYISGDKLLILFARYLEAKKVVTTVDASMAVDEMGFDVTRTKVGDIFVSEKLKKKGDFGGEPSGAWVFPQISLCPDGIFAAAQIAAMVNGKKLFEMADEIPQYPIVRGSVTGRKADLNGLEEKLSEMDPQSISQLDGYKLGFEDGWLLIRASGTEPKIRVTAEAKTAARAKELYDGAVKAIKASLKPVKE